MSTIMIDYDLNKPGQNYDSLIKEIKRLGGNVWCHPLKSSWVIKTTLSAAQVRDDLTQYVDNGDAMLVMNITGDNWASSGLQKDLNDWLQSV